MSSYSGPEIVSDSLVFHYDMGNTNKSWKGMPTTNLISIDNWNNTLTGWAGWFWVTGTSAMVTDDVLYDGVKTLKATFTGTATGGPAYLDLSGLSTTLGTKYTVSMWMKSSFRACYIYGHDTAGAGTVNGNTIVANGTWQRSTYTFTVVSTTGKMRIHIVGNSSAAGDVMYATAPQVELGDFASPFVNGTRSNTQCLLDLCSANTITASSLTYNANNTFSFNGSSNYIVFPENSALNTQTPTIDVWVKTNATTQNGFWFEKGTVNSQYALFQEGAYIKCRVNTGTLVDTIAPTTASFMNTTDWYNVVFTYRSGYQACYINGNLVGTGSTVGTLSTNTNGCSIGVYGGYNGGRGYYYNGSIAIVKIYNRVLSASEVDQNFNALRGRFGI